MITVVLTIYNRTEYYKESLDSLINQTQQNFELLIYSNIDINYDISKFKDVKIIENAPIELPLKYADGIKKAKNLKIAFLEDDDTFEINKIEYLDNKNFGYFHNDYKHLTSGNHIHGNGFNMSCIAINRYYFSDLSDELKNNIELGTMPDTFVYWYALEHDIPVTISQKKLTNYRFRDYKTLNCNAVSNMKNQIEKLKMFQQYFKSEKVQKIIKQRIIQDSIYLKSYGELINISFKDFIWLMVQKNADNRGSLLISYFLTLPILKGKGMNIINKVRKNKEVK